MPESISPGEVLETLRAKLAALKTRQAKLPRPADPQPPDTALLSGLSEAYLTGLHHGLQARVDPQAVSDYLITRSYRGFLRELSCRLRYVRTPR
jgi:hypothetical protein